MVLSSLLFVSVTFGIKSITFFSGLDHVTSKLQPSLLFLDGVQTGLCN